jgi:hypothetical protein
MMTKAAESKDSTALKVLASSSLLHKDICISLGVKRTEENLNSYTKPAMQKRSLPSSSASSLLEKK